MDLSRTVSLLSVVRRLVDAPGYPFHASLGTYVLIGDGRYEPSQTFRYVTSRAGPFDDTKPCPLRDGVVFGIRKRTRRFENVILLGRAESNDLSLQHESISKLHARITDVSRDGFLIEDADSRNGTFVNDVRVMGPTHVSCGDVISLGRRAFRVRRTDRLNKSLSDLTEVLAELDADEPS